MKAVVIHAAKDLRIEDRPVEPLTPGLLRLRLATGGVCGSDLHHYNHGGFGAVRLREPMILGHEVSACVEDPGTPTFAQGQLVAVSPSRPCGTCKFCLEGLPNQCLNMRFYGSAMPFPHIQGAFREVLVAEASQCVDATGLTPGRGGDGRTPDRHPARHHPRGRDRGDGPVGLHPLARRAKTARGDPATGPRRRIDPADDGDHRQGAGAARILPLSPRVRRRCGPDAEGPDRREAAHHPRLAPGAGQGRLPPRLGPQPAR